MGGACGRKAISMRRTRVSGLCGAKVRPQTETEALALLCGALQPFLQLLCRLVAPQANDQTSDEWIPHTRSPLGARRTRMLARRGVFPGARKVGRTWLIPRAGLNAYVEREGCAPSANDNGEGVNEDVRDMAAELGYSLTQGTGRSR